MGKLECLRFAGQLARHLLILLVERGTEVPVLLSAIKKLFFWNYARNTWQWDVLCVVILIFIFLTPKSWFENSERRGLITQQNPAVRTLVLSPEVVENAGDRGQLEQRVRTFMGRDDIRILDVRKLVDEHGRILGYEVDIH